MAKHLNAREEQFCQEMSKDPNQNQTECAKRAGYAEKSAGVTGCKLMKKAAVVRRINTLRKDLIQRTEMSKDDVINQIETVRKFDIGEFLDKDGACVGDIRKFIPKYARQLIQEFEQEVTDLLDKRGRIVGRVIKTKIKMMSKDKALEMAAKIMRLFTDAPNVQQTFMQVNWDEVMNPPLPPK